ncbi:hypothetical protein N7532_008870 [Penicillium argentinense]|uniref:Reverse transcriptase domain-containing protein n=1 Tax=Penicillium argentinense TaxID=1131581 RepID=A0A9W9EYH7_9EURO|nr:uncharacterized protein N7532_008870 [Penicillium argentinense]KAJ5090186.1 hypothetical protein N7532_008870 [Penicillium argentinense]
MDAAKCFYQWPIHLADRQHMAVTSPRRQEVFQIVIMGYCNSVAFVQRQMVSILRDFAGWCRAYVDGVFTTSPTCDDHLNHLHTLLARLEEFGIKLEPRKSYIAFPSIHFLGQRVDAFGMTTRDERIKAITNLQFPKTLKHLETYLGMTGTVLHYIRGYAAKIEPLQQPKTLLLRNSPVKGHSRRSFSVRTLAEQPSAAERRAFDELQAEFADSPWLTHHDSQRQLYVDLDASKEAGFGAMVFHVNPTHVHDISKPPAANAIQPVLFLSRDLSAAERNYWPTELEVACLVWVLRKIRHMVQAAPPHLPVVIYTDHSSTTPIAQSSPLRSVASDRLNLRLVRASQYIQQYRLRVFHRPGATNQVVDALSRLPTKQHEAGQSDDLDALLAVRFVLKQNRALSVQCTFLKTSKTE